MRTTLLLFACLLVFTLQAASQMEHPGPGGRPIERLERLRKVRMIEMLDLNEDQSARFFARLNDHEKARKDLRKDKNEILDRIERLLRNESDEKEYEPLFQEAEAIDQKIWENNRAFLDGLKDILTTEQRAKMVLFERRFESELREAMRSARQRRGGPDR